MASRKLILGSAGAAALGMRLARILHGRWRLRGRRDQKLLEPATASTREQEAIARAEPDYADAAARLRAASESLATTRVEAAESNPDLSAAEVAELRDDLRRELKRLADADVKALRTGLSTPPRG